MKPAPAGAGVRCVCFVDRGPINDPKGWEIIPQFHREEGSDTRRAAWHIRCVPHVRFYHYNAVVWVDASFTVTDLPKLLSDSEGHDLSALRHHKRSSAYDEGVEVVRNGQSDAADVSTQLGGYRQEGFKPSALSISCILVRQNNQRVTAFNELWDAEIRKHPGDNTQLSLDYCAWKTGVGVHHLQGVRKDNPYASHDHADHKRRRKPYR